MREADYTQTYEQRVEAIQQANQPILDGFETWLRQSGLSEQTITDHVDNIRFFSRYLLLYSYSLRRLDQATEGTVYDFLEDWFPRKALWASVSSMKVYLASFKKFYRWMGANGLVSAETVEDVLSTLKDSRNLFLPSKGCGVVSAPRSQAYGETTNLSLCSKRSPPHATI